jgi:hypothetical protein
MEERAPLRIELPERLDRTTRWGPFPSSGAALKFLLLGTLGAVVAIRFGALLWTPFLVGGFLLAVHRREGLSIDESLLAYVRFRLRGLRPYDGAGPGGAPRGRFHRTAGGRPALGLEAGGVPVAFLPPAEAEQLFRQYREFLRAHPATLLVRVGRAPLRATRFLPANVPAASPAEGAARAGYAELLTLISQRRSRRRVRLLLVGEPGAAGTARLEGAYAALLRTLDAMGIRASPLRDRSLAAFAAGTGSSEERP